MAALWLISRAELRARWKTWLALALLVGVASGVVLTAAAGARRGAGAFDRFAAATRMPDVEVGTDPAYFDAIANLPQVDAAAPGALITASPRPDFSSPRVVLGVAAMDERFTTAVDRPDMVAGRLPRFGSVEEVAINEVAAAELGVGVGSSQRVRSLTPDQLEGLFTGAPGGAPAGPTVDVVVTGVFRTARDLGTGAEALMLFTPAFYRTYRGQIGELVTILEVRLRGGLAALPAFEAAVGRVVPDSADVSFDNTIAEQRRQVEDRIGVEVVALASFAVAAGLAALVVAGQAAARQVHAGLQDDETLHALGLSRTERVLAAVAPAAPVAALGAFLGVVLSVAASPLMPVGVAREAELDPGLSVDPLVLCAGAIAVLVLVVGRVGLAAWRALRRAERPGAPLRASPVAVTVARARVTPVAATGVRMALEPGRGRTAVPVGPALAAAAVGVGGVVAAVVFAASLQRLVSTPTSYGWTWDAAVEISADEGGGGRGNAKADDLAARADVDGVATLAHGRFRLEGEAVEGFSLERVEGSEFATVIEGRAPVGRDEVLLGTGPLRRADAEVGSTIEAQTPEGRRKLRVVGRGVFPDLEGNDLDDFALLTPAGLASVANGAEDTMILLRWAEGVDEEVAGERLARDAVVIAPDRPTKLDNLAGVDAYPRVLTVFLAVLGVAAVGHVLVTAVRRRRRDLAVLSALGFLRSQVGATVAWQSTTYALVGLLVGIPLGIVLGRWAYVLVIGGLGAPTDVTVPLRIALVVPAVLLVASVLAVVPGHMASRTRPAVALRAE
jgi:hypothetical protein